MEEEESFVYISNHPNSSILISIYSDSDLTIDDLRRDIPYLFKMDDNTYKDIIAILFSGVYQFGVPRSPLVLNVQPGIGFL